MIDRKSYRSPFKKGHSPEWLCPTCGKGSLKIKKDTFHSEELRNSRDHTHEEWDPEWISSVYACLFYCTNDNCKEVVASTGICQVVCDDEDDYLGNPVQVYNERFYPKYNTPPLRIITLPANCPTSISESIEESFYLFIASPSASANSIRVAAEHLLTELKIRRFELIKGKRRFIPLHNRILLLPSDYSNIKDLLLAIKWLGNAGSHSREIIGIEDVMDAYELFEHILDEIYVMKDKKLKKMAKKVNKKKGPMRR
jgi:hypothetical protein